MKTNKSSAKKTWRKPKLTVLVRGAPEERVLASGCKTTAGGPSRTGVACDNPVPIGLCFTQNGS